MERFLGGKLVALEKCSGEIAVCCGVGSVVFGCVPYTISSSSYWHIAWRNRRTTEVCRIDILSKPYGYSTSTAKAP